METWIDVNDELPKDEERVLACHNAVGETFFAKYSVSSKKWYREPRSGMPQAVTHWMASPQPPQK